LLFIGIKKWNEYIEENVGDKNGYWEPSLGDGVLTRNLGLNIIVVVTMVCILIGIIDSISIFIKRMLHRQALKTFV